MSGWGIGRPMSSSSYRTAPEGDLYYGPVAGGRSDSEARQGQGHRDHPRTRGRRALRDSQHRHRPGVYGRGHGHERQRCAPGCGGLGKWRRGPRRPGRVDVAAYRAGARVPGGRSTPVAGHTHLGAIDGDVGVRDDLRRACRRRAARRRQWRPDRAAARSAQDSRAREAEHLGGVLGTRCSRCHWFGSGDLPGSRPRWYCGRHEPARIVVVRPQDPGGGCGDDAVTRGYRVEGVVWTRPGVPSDRRPRRCLHSMVYAPSWLTTQTWSWSGSFRRRHPSRWST